MLDQECREIEMEVENRLQQRTDTLRIGEVRVRSRLDQQLPALQAAAAGSVQQGSKPARRPSLHARLGGDLARPVVDQRPFVHGCAVLEQQAHHGRLRLCRRPHQRALVAPFLARIDLGAVRDQHFGGRNVAGPCQDH